MLQQYPKRSEPTFLTIVLLTLSIVSAALIVIRLVYNTTLYASGLLVFGSYILSFILLFLSGAHLFQKPWSLFPLSIIGKGYFILTIALLLIRAENILDIAWLSTSVSCLYIALLNYINPIRTYTGQEKVSNIFIAGRVASAIFLFGTLAALYLMLIPSLFPEYAYKVRYREYNDLVFTSDISKFPAYTWSENWKIAVPDGMAAIKKDVGIGVWTNSDGERIIVTSGVWTQQVERNPFLGFTGPFRFEKAIWNSGIGQPFLLVLKMVVAGEKTQAFLLESPAVNAMIFLNHSESSSAPEWDVSANVYPADEQPYAIESTASSRERALLPVHITLRKLQDGT